MLVHSTIIRKLFILKAMLQEMLIDYRPLELLDELSEYVSYSSFIHDIKIVIT